MTRARIVCTGATGTIGRYLPSEVIQLRSRLEASTDEMRAELAAVEKGIAGFIHLAAVTSVKRCEADPERAFELNVNGTRKWLHAAASVGCPRFVHASTCHVFRPTATAEWLEPGREGDAVSAYGRSKLEAEHVVFADAHVLGIEAVIARVFSLIADGMPESFLYPALQRRARERDFSRLPGYKNVRDFIEAADAASRLWRIASASHLDSRIFHLCTGQPKSVRTLAIEVMGQSGIGDAATAPMFPENDDAANFLISKPSPIPQDNE